jgi:hypothetical protein
VPAYLKYPLLAIKVIIAFFVVGVCILLALFIGFDYTANSFPELLFNEFWIAIKPILFLLPAVLLIDFFVEKKLRKIFIFSELILIPLSVVLRLAYAMLHWYLFLSIAAGYQNIGYERSSGRFPDQGSYASIYFYSPGKTYGNVKSTIENRVAKANDLMGRLFFSNANPITFDGGPFQDADILTNSQELGVISAGF